MTVLKHTWQLSKDKESVTYLKASEQNKIYNNLYNKQQKKYTI